MMGRVRNWVWDRIVARLNREKPLLEQPPCDFERLSYEIRPCDVLLIEGRSRVGEVIKYITLSPWTHAALYIGRLHDIDDPETRDSVRAAYPAAADEQLIIEALLGEGTIVAPLSRYREDHVRICRPRGIARRDAQAVVNYCVSQLGHEYDVRQLVDLGRFMFPYALLPRRLRSSLFTHNVGAPTRTVCSSLIARAFASVRFPVLPLMRADDSGTVRLDKRNFKLFVPADFDYSPYFDVIKYPLIDFDEVAPYQRMPWTAEPEDESAQASSEGADAAEATTEDGTVEHSPSASDADSAAAEPPAGEDAGAAQVERTHER